MPKTLGRYTIHEELGRGAMGRVFLAYDPRIDRKVAIKTIQSLDTLPTGERDEALERFLTEARAAGKLMHPGIVTLFDVGEADGQLYLAMEYVEGTTLDEYCRKDNLLDTQVVIEMVARVAEALDYAHAAGIVHRDIKPANLMRVGPSAVKIMDFGLARPSEARISRDGSLRGTPSYMSPEQIRGNSVDGRSDLFSLAVVLFELLCGERPFPGDSVSSVIYRIVNEEPATLPAATSGRNGPELEAFLVRSLDKEPERRCKSGAEFARELRAAAGALPAPDPVTADPNTTADAVTVEKLPPQRAKPPRSSALPFIAGLVILIAATAPLGWIYRESLGIDRWFAPKVIWWETVVRSEPPGLPVQLDGAPLSAEQGDRVRFSSAGPFGLLTATQLCRTAEHRLEPADGGGEVVLVVDPVELRWRLAPEPASARAQLNGEELGGAPVDLTLDLCQDNRLELSEEGYRPLTVEIPAGATPLEARTLLGSLELEPIPRGRLVLPSFDVDLVWYVDGRRLGPAERELELLEGEYPLRFKNDYFWIDVRDRVRVVGDETVTPALALPALGTLVVQAFPANCKVSLRRPGGRWRYLDDTPFKRRIAVGAYDVRVEFIPTGETRDERVELKAGENPPLRVSFGRNG